MSVRRTLPLRLRLASVIAPVALVLVAFAAAPASASVATVSPTAVNTWGTNGRVSAILPAGDRVYVAGSFTAVTDASGNSYPIPYLAAFIPATGSFDTSWHPEPDGAVMALAISNGTLFLGGKFTSVQGSRRHHLAAVDASTGQLSTSWQPSANKAVRALATGGGYVYVGGSFDTLTDSGGQEHAGFNFLARLSANTGEVSEPWHPLPDAQVNSLVMSPTDLQLYVGGDFDSISGNSRMHSIASLDTILGLPTPGFVSGPTNGTDRPQAFNLSLDGTHLLAAVGGTGGGCASLSAVTGATQWNVRANGNVQAVTGLGGVVYCGGHFGPASGNTDTFGGTTRHKLAAVDELTGTVLDFAPRVNSSLGVWALASQVDTLFAGGDFTKVNRVDHPYFAEFR